MTSPRTRAWLRNSSISRSRACMRRVPYRACWRASCGRSRSLRARSSCSASPCSPSTRRATRPSRRPPRSRGAGGGGDRGSRGDADVRSVCRSGARARAGPLARAGDHRRRRRRARRAVRRAGGRLAQLLGAPRRADAHRPRALRLRPVVPGPLRAGTSLTGAGGRSPEARFGEQAGLAIGAEEELILVKPATRALSHAGGEVLERMGEPDASEGFAHPDTYSALIELASPVTHDAGEGVAALGALRARVRAAGGTVVGAGIHPDGAFGDVVHVDEPRYHRIVEQLQGLITRTPTCALHVHVGMPDAQTAIRVFNGLREQ